MKVKICQNHIDNGLPSNSNMCPIVLAMEDMGITITCGQHAVWITGSIDHRIDLPYEARKFINDFDSGKPVMPFSFELETI